MANKKTPKTVYFVAIPLFIILNIILILIGYFIFISGYIELAILIWILKGLLDVFLIWLIIWLIKFATTEPPPNPPCVLFLGVVIAIAIFLSMVNILI
ncbi:MAG: hypothetical protein ACFFDH_15030 [Promethearchaeota archaeon]